MKKWFILFAGMTAATTFAPAASFAQGIGIDPPGVAGQYRHHYSGDWDSPRVYPAARHGATRGSISARTAAP